MGQRLNIEIHENGITLANCYYHWSGYTSSSLNLTKQIIDSELLTDKFIAAIPDKVAIAVALLKETGADNIDRNNGLIGTTDREIAETREWQEAAVYIDIGTKSIKFDNFYYLSEEDINERELPINSINTINFELEHCTFDEFDYYYNTITNLINSSVYEINTPNGIVAFIE